MRYQKRVIMVMPDTAPEVRPGPFFRRPRSVPITFARDHETGERDWLTREITETEGAVQASPYDDPHVIAGNGSGRAGDRQ